MSELDPRGIEAAAKAVVGAEVGYEMKLSRLVDGVSTYTLTLETGERFEFDNTDDCYEKIAREKAARQAEAAITAYLSTVSPLSDGDGRIKALEAELLAAREALKAARSYVEAYDTVGMNDEQTRVLGLVDSALSGKGSGK